MSSFKTLDYAALDLSGDNWLEWAMNTSEVLMSRRLGQCITKGEFATESDNERAITIMRHHLTNELKDQYIQLENPRDLWTELQSRYSKALLPKVRYEWISLRIQDFESVEKYDLALSKIVSKLRLCGETITEEDLLEKTFTTANPRDLLLQFTYREKGFTTYNDLFTCLLQAEMKHENVKEKSKGAVSKVTESVAGLHIN